MSLPNLKAYDSSNNHWDNYDATKRFNIVTGYLFKGISHRDLEEAVLGLDKSKTKGWISMDILHTLGLSREFKSLFKGKSINEAVKVLQSKEDEQYNKLITFLLQGNN